MRAVTIKYTLSIAGERLCYNHYSHTHLLPSGVITRRCYTVTGYYVECKLVPVSLVRSCPPVRWARRSVVCCFVVSSKNTCVEPCLCPGSPSLQRLCLMAQRFVTLARDRGAPRPQRGHPDSRVALVTRLDQVTPRCWLDTSPPRRRDAPHAHDAGAERARGCLLYTSPSPRDS